MAQYSTHLGNFQASHFANFSTSLPLFLAGGVHEAVGCLVKVPGLSP